MNQLFGQTTDPVESDLGANSVPVRPLPGPGSEQAFFQLEIKRSLKLHWKLARNVAIGGVVAAIAYFLVQSLVLRSWPAFVAESMVFVEPVQSKVFEGAQGGSPRWPYDNNTYESFIQQQMMNVTRDDVLASALKKIGDFQRHGESQQAAAQRLAQALTVTREGNAYTFSIGARAGTAEFAADIANDVTAAYLESIQHDLKAGDAQRLAMLKDEKDRIGKELDADRAEQEALNKQLGIASVGNALPDHFDEDITSTRTELIKARTDHDAAEAKFAAFDAGHGPSSTAIDAAADEIIASDAGLVSMKTSLNQRRATIISQMANLTPSHPQYKQDEVELGKINNELDSMMRDLRGKAAARIQLQLQAELQRTAGVESQLNGQLRRLVGSAGSATPKMQRANDLSSDISRLQARYASVDEQVHNLMLEDNAPASAHQVSPAVPPLSRTKTGVLRNVFLIVFAGVIFGVIAAILAHKLDPRIYIARDVERVLGFAPLAQLPDFNEVSSGVAEEYLLRLASTIEHARKQSRLRSCVFTGANSGNGVSLLVSRVSGMLEAMGRSTVLVDASGAPAPDTPPAAPTAATPGLVPVERVSRPTALLQQMVDESESQDENLVLTDTAPLPVSAETEYLVRFVDCAIIVIESGKTTRRELRQVAATLQRLDVAAVGFVLNRIGLEKANSNFRNAVLAIEKHLETQKAGQEAFRAEAVRTLPSQSLWQTPEPVKSEAAPQENPARAHFEAEAAAASAAVARVSHPAVAHVEGEVSKPIVVQVPEAEPTLRFSAPFVPAQETAEKARAAEEEPTVEPEVTTGKAAKPAAQPVAPFLEAAHQVTATSGAHPVSQSSSAERALFAALGGSFSGDDVVKHEPAPLDMPKEEPYKLLFTKAEPGEQPAMADVPAHAPETTDNLHSTHEDFLSLHEVGERLFAGAKDQGFSIADFLKSDPALAEHLKVEPTVEERLAGAPASARTEGSSFEPHFVEPAVAQSAIAESGAHETAAHSGPEPVELTESGVAENRVEPVQLQERVATHEPEPIAVEAEAAPETPATPVANAPWWAGEGGQRAAKRPPVIWKPAKVRVSVPPSEHVASSQNVFTQGHPWATGSVTHGWNTGENAQVGAYDAAHHAGGAMSEGHVPEQEESGEPLTSRLSGLRNLLFVLGVKEGQNAEDERPEDGHTDQPGERTISAAPELEDRNDVAPAHIGGASPKLVTAPPEFLSPKAASINSSREPLPPSQCYVHLERRPHDEGVGILPSQKGQYKKV